MKNLLKMWLPWQQKMSIFHILVSKHDLCIFRKNFKVSRKNFLSFRSYVSKTTEGEGWKYPPVYDQNFYGGRSSVWEGGSSERCLKWGGGGH